VDTATASDVQAQAVVAEGRVRGWLNRRKAEHDQRRLEDERYRAALAKLRGGDDSPETMAELRGLVDPRHRSEAHSALLAFSERLLADDLLSTTEEARWQGVGDALGVSQADLNQPEFKGLLVRLTIARINDGRLPEVPAGQAHLMAKRGEIVHLETAAALMKEVIDREFRGGSRGVSVPIAKGVRFRTGSFRGKSVVVGSHLEAADTGIISVSSKRVVFMGTRKTLDTPYAKLASLDAFSDGIRIHASNRQGAPLFRLPVGGQVVAAAIQAAAQRET
jgi:hypothetical protein